MVQRPMLHKKYIGTEISTCTKSSVVLKAQSAWHVTNEGCHHEVGMACEILSSTARLYRENKIPIVISSLSIQPSDDEPQFISARRDI